jgi:hypothetical protein
VSKTLEKYRTIAQHQLAIRQSGFFGFVTTKILNRFLEIQWSDKNSNFALKTAVPDYVLIAYKNSA